VLRPLELIPVVSWAALGGRCRQCHEPIGRIHPACEVGAVLLVLWAILAVPDDLVPATAILGWGLFAIALIDQRQFIIPNALSLPLGLLGLLLPLTWDPPSIDEHAAGALLAGPARRILAHRPIRARGASARATPYFWRASGLGRLGGG
jgi:leader peptidase (prepilin peptidase)/N-methyltransferase